MIDEFFRQSLKNRKLENNLKKNKQNVSQLELKWNFWEYNENKVRHEKNRRGIRTKYIWAT